MTSFFQRKELGKKKERVEVVVPSGEVSVSRLVYRSRSILSMPTLRGTDREGRRDVETRGQSSRLPL